MHPADIFHGKKPFLLGNLRMHDYLQKQISQLLLQILSISGFLQNPQNVGFNMMASAKESNRIVPASAPGYWSAAATFPPIFFSTPAICFP